MRRAAGGAALGRCEAAPLVLQWRNTDRQEEPPMFFFFPISPLLPVLAVYILAAVLPAAFLLRYIYRHDTVEKEPPGLLALLLGMGVLAAVCSGVLEGLGMKLGQLVRQGVLVPCEGGRYYVDLSKSDQR